MIARVLAINVLATAALLLALEVGSRILRPTGFPDPLILDTRTDWNETFAFDPVLFWRVRPGAERNGETLTNRLGLRGPELAAKQPGELRILSLGESTTFGIRRRYEETYSARLEHALRERLERPVRVVNAGAPGYSLFQGVTFLERRGLALEPDAVIVYFGYNDFLPVSFRRRRDAGATRDLGGVSDRELAAMRERLPSRIGHALATHSNFVRMLLFRKGGDVEAAGHGSKPRVSEADRRELLRRLDRITREHGLRLAIIVPWYREFDLHEPLLREVAAELGVPLVDLPRRLAELPKPRAAYFVDPVHPNRRGHALIADVLADELRAIWGF